MMEKSVRNHTNFICSFLKSNNIFYLTGFPNPWDVILNKRRFEYAMVCNQVIFIKLKNKLFSLSIRNSKAMMIPLI